MKIKRVAGVQAEGASDLGLVKITRDSAKQMYAHGERVVIVGNKVGAHAFFKGWHLAHTLDPKEKYREGSGAEFDVIANSFNSYLEPELGSRPAFFVDKEVLPKRSRATRHTSGTK